MTVSEAFGDVAEILARLNPAQILKLRASSAMAERVEELVEKKKRATSLGRKLLNWSVIWP